MSTGSRQARRPGPTAAAVPQRGGADVRPPPAAAGPVEDAARLEASRLARAMRADGATVRAVQDALAARGYKVSLDALRRVFDLAG